MVLTTSATKATDFTHVPRELHINCISPILKSYLLKYIKPENLVSNPPTMARRPLLPYQKRALSSRRVHLWQGKQSSGSPDVIPWHTFPHNQKSPVTSPSPLSQDSSHRRTFPNMQPAPRESGKKQRKERKEKRCLRLLKAWHLGLITGLGLRSRTLSFQGYAPLPSVSYVKILPAVSIYKPRIGNTSFPHASVDKYLGGTQIFQVHIRTLLP